MTIKGRITDVKSSVVKATGMTGIKMNEVVKVGELGLIGEAIRIEGDNAYVQVYEFTTDIKPGEPVIGMGSPLSVELGPGMVGQIYDGMQRPLPTISKIAGSFIPRGVNVTRLDKKAKWKFMPTAKLGDVVGDDVLGYVDETQLVRHYIMVPPNIRGRLTDLTKEGEYTLKDEIGTVEMDGVRIPLHLYQEWPVWTPRPFKEKMETKELLVVGQRVIDTFFPLAKGGTAAVPGGFGTGKCVLPETRILLNGELKEIGEVWRSGGTIRTMQDGLYRRIDGVVSSFVGTGFSEESSPLIYKGRSRSMVEITTGQGRRLVVTPNHGIYVYSASKGITTRPAVFIRPGDLLVEPLAGRFSSPSPSKLGHDTVTGARVLNGTYDVYDLVVPGAQNFLGGETPTIYHNTVLLHQIASWAKSSMVIYVGCGERGNEMTDILMTFPHLKDPYSDRPLMEKTVLIANISNMPVMARQASIYAGTTIAEYFRDMGYDTLLLADSTSRWAEALREISGRLEEMPAEEGYPSYLASRLAAFYERAGNVMTLGSQPRNGSLTIMGAVSPQGGDFTEPVTSNTLRFVKAFLLLDPDLAYSRHYPAVNWISSYSGYTQDLSEWLAANVNESFSRIRDEAYALLQKENALKDIVRLLGSEMLPNDEKLVLDMARVIRQGFLQQSAYDKVDRFSSPKVQYYMLSAIVEFYSMARKKIEAGARIEDIRGLPVMGELVYAKNKFTNDSVEGDYAELMDRMKKQFDGVKSN
ncbi:MAG: V-type ATP synthase subunit A [Nitrososphaerota archaeon]|nr:V-type ATP synthase subunit A [Nitrososphaerota archaeon]